MANPWDQRYDRPDYLFGTEPNAFLKAEALRLVSGWKVLCVADGEGRNGVFLAEQGLEVTAVEGSPVAIAKARRLAGARGVAMDLIEADLATWTWPTAAFDAVIAIFIQFADPALRARIFAGMQQALKPGGLLLLLSFYLAVGIALQGLQGRLTKRVLAEFAFFGVVALILIVVFGPGF